MKAKDIMTQNPEIISPETTLKQAAEKMRDQNFGFLPIGECGRRFEAASVPTPEYQVRAFPNRVIELSLRVPE